VAEDFISFRLATATPEQAPVIASTVSDEGLPVVVIGAGIAGATAARELARYGHSVRLLERRVYLGGRLGSRVLRGTGTQYDGRPTGLGSPYLTARDEKFVEQVRDWAARGVVESWADIARVAGPAGLGGYREDMHRYTSPQGMSSVVEDLITQAEALADENGQSFELKLAHQVSQVTWSAADSVLRNGRPELLPRVDGELAKAVILAIPDPAALELLPSSVDDVGAHPSLSRARAQLHRTPWMPTLSLVTIWDDRDWEDFHVAFVNHADEVQKLIDDGSRAGDNAPITIAHAPTAFSAEYLEDPARAVVPMLSRVTRILGTGRSPLWVGVQRWTNSRPQTASADGSWWEADARLGLAGDGWSGSPRVEGAYLSGHDVARRLVHDLA
jgi:predicted NAD/FAD-dependent oxidoreductase